MSQMITDAWITLWVFFHKYTYAHCTTSNMAPCLISVWGQLLFAPALCYQLLMWPLVWSVLSASCQNPLARWRTMCSFLLIKNKRMETRLTHVSKSAFLEKPIRTEKKTNKFQRLTDISNSLFELLSFSCFEVQWWWRIVSLLWLNLLAQLNNRFLEFWAITAFESVVKCSAKVLKC